ncbi:MAG: SpoIIE family protein phosphatase [bacterium]
MKFSLRTKLIALTTFVVTLTMADVMYFFTIRELHDKSAAVESQMARVARNIASMQLVENQSWNDYQNYIDQLLPLNEDIVYIAVYDDRNWLRAHALNHNWIELRPAPLSARERARIVRQLDQGLIAEESRDDLRTQRVNIQSGEKVLGSVSVGFSLVDINNELRQGVWHNVVMAIIFLAFFSAIAVVLSRKLSRPLERLSQAMTAIAKGSPEQKVKVEGHDEIAQLAKTFNLMVDGLQERKIIETMGREMSASFHLEHLAAVVTKSLGQAVRADRVRLYVRQKGKNGRYQEICNRGDGDPVQLDEAAHTFLCRQAQPFMLESAPEHVKDPLFSVRAAPQDVVLPLLIKREVFGLVVFGRKGSARALENRRSTFASTLAGQAAIALENALLSEELREQEKMKRELEIAHEVQQKLLPDRMPTFGDYQFDGICLPAQEIGGDYFDFFPISKNKLGVVIADVSGKGTSAAFYMAEIKGMMSSLAYIYSSPRKVLCELNRGFCSGADRTVFATVLYGVLEADTRQFTFVRAGHNPLYHIRRHGECRVLTPGGLGVGLEASEVFSRSLQESQVELHNGDTLLLFTDGITESMNHTKAEFGEHRLLDAFRACGALKPEAIRQRILHEVATFTAGADQHDDLTMIVIQNGRQVQKPE